GTHATLWHCKATGQTPNNAINLAANFSKAILCEATGCAVTAFNVSQEGALLLGCTAISNTAPGAIVSNSFGSAVLFCVFANNTGANSDGLQIGNVGVVVHGNVFYNNGRDGLRGTAANVFDDSPITNNIFAKNTGYGINSTSTNYGNGTANFWQTDSDCNAYFSNTSGPRNNMPAAMHDVTLTGDPFTSG